MGKRLGIIALIIAAVALLLSGEQRNYQSLNAQLKTSQVLFDAQKPLLDFSLQDQKGAVFDNQRLKGHWSLLFFGYTHCPDVCPTGLMDMVQLKAQLKANNTLVPEVVFITFDPERDTPAMLDKFLAYFDQDFIGVTGTQSEIDRLIKPFGAYYERVVYEDNKERVLKKSEPLPAGTQSYLINHTAWMYLIAPSGEIFAGFPAPHKPVLMAEDIKTLISAYEQ